MNLENIRNNYTYGKLKNGMKYILNNNSIFASSSIYLLVRVGSINEDDKTSGLSHLLEHMLFKGSEKYPDFMTLNKKIDDLNGHINAETSKNNTGYYIKFPSKNMLKALDIINQMVFNSLIPQEELDKERKIVIEEYYRSIDNSGDYLDDLLTKNNFNNHRLSRLIIGTKKNINKFNSKELIKFYKKFYIPSNCVLSISGKIPSNIEKILNEIFVYKKKQNLIKHTFNDSIIRNSRKLICRTRKQNQISFGMCFPIFNVYDKRKFFVDILIDILGGNMTSRLWIALREKNPLVYNFNVFYEIYEEGGLININFGVDKKNLKKAFQSVINEIKKLKEGQLTEKEVSVTINKTKIESSIGAEDNLEIAKYYGQQLILEEEIINYKKMDKIYESATKDKIVKLCNDIFVFNNLTIAQIGNLNNNELKDLVNKINF